MSFEKPIIGLMHITAKEKEMWDPNSTWSLYEALSTADLYRSFGYDVDVLTYNEIEGCLQFKDVDANDYDLIVCQSVGPAIIDSSILPENEVQYRFLASVSPEKVIVILGNDASIDFKQLEHEPNIPEKYKTDEYRIKARTQFLAQTEDLAYAKKALDHMLPASQKMPIKHAPLWVHAFNWLRDGASYASLSEIKPFDIVYPGRVRSFSNRASYLSKLIPDKGVILWTGANQVKAEKWLSRSLKNVTFEEGTSNSKGAILYEAYNRAYTTFIPYEPGMEQMITPRAVEACLSTAVVYISDEWPLSSAIFRHFPFLLERRISSGFDLLVESKLIATSKTMQEKLLSEQQSAMKSLNKQLNNYRLAIQDALLLNIS